MELSERLRLRSQQVKQTAQVDCLGLGALTVQALPIRECQALSRGPDGDRAILYAACRQLQTAGEELRREGKLFRPDEIMQLVSEEEARAGAAAVRQLSGLDPEQDGGELETQTEQNETPLSQTLDRENQMDKIRLHTVQAAYPSGPENGIKKVRLENVQNFGNQSSETGQKFQREPEVGQVSRESEGESDSVCARPDSQDGQKIQRKPAVNRPIYGAGTLSTAPKKGEKQGAETDRSIKIKSESAVPERGELHEIKSESGEAGHEHRTQSHAPERGRLHEIKSESGEAVHEIKSEFPARAGDGLHEIKSESSEGVHEIKSEFPARAGDGLHEIKSELWGGVHVPGTESQGQTRPFPPVTEELAREVAQAILDGLRRAAGAR